MAGSTRRWKDVRSAQPVNEMRASIYRRLEVRAVFGDEAVVLRRDPEPAS